MEDEEEGVESECKPNDAVAACWRDKKGLFHRLNGPAVIFYDKDRSWYCHGKLHRDDGPAKEWPADGIEEWYKDDVRYEPSAHELMLWKMKKKA